MHRHTLKGFKTSTDIFKGHMLTEKVNSLEAQEGVSEQKQVFGYS